MTPINGACGRYPTIHTLPNGAYLAILATNYTPPTGELLRSTM
ncbi:hypothetical protein AAD001_17035 [Colwelliaceae bacterium 6471]